MIHKKKRFDENVDCDNIQSAEESFRIGNFLYMLDEVISSLKTRFEQFQMYENIFGFLFDFKKLKSLDEDILKRYYLNLEDVLKCDGLSDIDGLDLFLELKLLREVLHRENSSPSETLDYIEKVDSFPNASIAYKILLTIPVTVASVEMSFQS